MATEHRWVFDTNVIVSALLFDTSVPGRAFFHALNSGRILASREMLLELQEVLSRKKFEKYVTPDERDAFLVALTRAAEVIEVRERLQVCRDPDDNKVLELAVTGAAGAIITGDTDLLSLHPYRDIPILTPARYLELHGSEVQ
jgi:putative PIN family toxin of toxin-antitoxin system